MLQCRALALRPLIVQVQVVEDSGSGKKPVKPVRGFGGMTGIALCVKSEPHLSASLERLQR